MLGGEELTGHVGAQTRPFRGWHSVPLLEIDPSWAQILNGLVLLFAIAAYAALERARLRSLRRA